MNFPMTRMRRLRHHPALRDMVRETTLEINDLIMPLFIVEGLQKREEIVSMPGQYRLPLSETVEECRKLHDLGVKSVILFGIPETKDETGSGAWIVNGIMQQAIRLIKEQVPDMYVIADVCLCEYTSHGHCGIMKDGDMLNDPSLELIARTALSQKNAGADMVAPSNMADGSIMAIRKELDEHGHFHTPIMSYAAKYASAYYGPFRDAADSAPQYGDRKTYQMDPANAREAISEIQLDIEEGADIIMVKPALAYMDIIHAARQQFNQPIAAYNVSGEYAMIKAAAAKGWIDEKRIVMETLTGIKRAGANIILTYFAADVAKWLK